jgi:hypothetical protein
MDRATHSLDCSLSGWRNWRKFSLRSFLLAITFVAICLGIWVERAKRQKEAVFALRSKGFSVAYDYYVERGSFNGHGTTWLSPDRPPSRLSSVVGIDFCHNAIQVNLSYGQKNDALPLLRQLPRLRKVIYPWTGPADDKGLKHLRTELPGVEIEAFPAIVG